MRNGMMVRMVALLALAVVPLASAQEKILRIPMTTSGPNTMDPVIGSTTYDNRCCAQIYECLLQYKYLKRPLELEPGLLAEMPEISDDGTVWTFRLKEGVLFHDPGPSPCFDGKATRALTSTDVLYSFKRLADPANKYKNWWLVDGYIKGFNEFRDAQKDLVDAGNDFDYEAPVSGMRIVDDHTFVIELNKNEQQFMWRLAMFQLSIVPREAVEQYGTNFNRHPVGTGPFMLKQERDWVANTRVLFHKNPHYRQDTYPTEYMPEDEQAGLHEASGRTIPFVDKVEFNFFVESQPMWLRFREGEMDFTTVPADNFFEAYDRRTKEIRRAWERRGIQSHGVPLLDMIFRGFNMEDELVGGYTPEKKALRQAICLATDLYEMNESRYNGTAIVYDGPIPPGLDGHPENHVLEDSYQGPDYERARQKLREAGYTVENGKVTDLPTIEFYTSRGAESEKIVAILQRSLEVVGIKLNPHYQDFSALMGTVDNRKAPMFSFAWGSDYPDGENNLALFYGPNESPGSNHFNYKNDEYDRMYERIKTMPPGPERTEMYVKMRDMIIEDSPFSGSMARVRHYLVHPWLKNFKPTEDFFNYFKYLDVDLSHPRRPE